jgi:adenylate cyclase
LSKKINFRIGLTDKMVLIGVGLAIVYWILDTILSIFMSFELNVIGRVLGVGYDELWPRIIVICLFVIFGSHAQYTINERKKAEERSIKELATRERFQRLLSPDLAEMVVSGSLNVEKGGKTRVATVMFVDIRGFTAMSEKMSAGKILQILNEYYELIVDIVFYHEGTVDKFIGDAIMVIWGAPIEHKDDPKRAVNAALDIQRELVKFNEILAKKGLKEFRVGIGINTGSLVAGYIGSTQTMSYSVIGDTVNTASRICSAAEANQIIISKATYNAVRNDFQVKSLDPINAKGKYKPVNVYQVMGEK